MVSLHTVSQSVYYAVPLMFFGPQGPAHKPAACVTASHAREKALCMCVSVCVMFGFWSHVLERHSEGICLDTFLI